MIQHPESIAFPEPIIPFETKPCLGLRRSAVCAMIVVALFFGTSLAQSANLPTDLPALAELSKYFEEQTALLRSHCLSDIKTLADWTSRRDQYRRQLFEMLSLDPLPPKTDLKPVVTGKVEQDEFTVENLHFQSMPGLYVTANLYLPKNLDKPVPTILYVSGHGPVISNGVSYGNKVAYQHHGAWFARNGYVCLILDSLQLGEILGLHHGTYRENLWWWNARGYTPAGVEAWNCIRALDYLSTRPEVDTNRFGVTGRSGGGAYSWWITALDERIKVAAPVAGITDLQNHVVDGTVEGHCDCMFIVNAYRWDYPQVAALAAPRPLLIVNTDNDTIFPLDGVEWLHAKVKNIYQLYHSNSSLGLVIGPGPHKDTQNMQVPVFRWFNRHLKGADPLIAMAATRFFEPPQLQVFKNLPSDRINSNIHSIFVPAAKAVIPETRGQWAQQKKSWLRALKEKSFGGWPEDDLPLDLQVKYDLRRDGLRLRALDFTSQSQVRLRLYLLSKARLSKPKEVQLSVLGPGPKPSNKTSPEQLACYRQLAAVIQTGFGKDLDEAKPSAEELVNADEILAALKHYLKTNDVLISAMAPRGLGPNPWKLTDKQLAQVRRRFMLLGQTLDAMRVWDIRRGIQVLRAVTKDLHARIHIHAEGDLACDALYAAQFEPNIAELDLQSLPISHMSGPDYLNVLRVLDIPQTVTMAVEHSVVKLHATDSAAWDYPQAVSRKLHWPSSNLILQPR